MLSQQSTITDFSGKAERRGVQRAAIELALNLLATNQEQHRPLDKFRRVVLPPSYQPPPKEVRLCLDLEPWKRPVEQDPFKITKILLKYRRWKDHLYSEARVRAIKTTPGHLEPPTNYNGPFTLSSEYGLWASTKNRQRYLVQVQAALISAGRKSPRPLIHRLSTVINEALMLPLNDTSHPLADPGGEEQQLEMKDLRLLLSLCATSWNEHSKPYPDFIAGREDSAANIRAQLDEFERDVNLVMNELPLWEPQNIGKPVSTAPDESDFYIQPLYNSQIWTVTGMDLSTLLQDKINKSRQERAKGLHQVHLWSLADATHYLSEMHHAGRIQ